MTTATTPLQQELEEATYALEAARKDRADGFGVYAMLSEDAFKMLEQRLLDWQTRARESLCQHIDGHTDGCADGAAYLHEVLDR